LHSQNNDLTKERKSKERKIAKALTIAQNPFLPGSSIRRVTFLLHQSAQVGFRFVQGFSYMAFFNLCLFFTFYKFFFSFSK